MIPVIVPNPAGIEFCAGRRYRFEATECEDADFVRWRPISLPPGVLWGDIVQTNEFGIVNYMIFPAPGEYCFDVACGVVA